MRWAFTRSLLYPLTGILVALAVLPLALLGWAFVSSNRDQVETREMQYLSTQGIGLANDVEVYFLQTIGRIDVAAQLLRSSSVVLAETETTAMLKEIVQGNPNILWLQVLDVAGQGQSVQNPSFGDSTARALAPVLAQAFRDTLKGQPVRKDYLRLTGEAPVAVVSLPLLTLENKVRGVIQGVVSLKGISDRLLGERGRGVTIDVVDNTGEVLFSNLATRVGASAAVHPLVVQFLEAPVRLTLTRTYDDPLRPSHDEVLGSLCPVDSPRWAIVTARDVEVAFAAVTSMAQRTFLLGLVAGVVAMTAGFFLARRITLPLRHLADVTTAVAGGDFARRVPVTSQNELGQLAANFNVMADEIERYIKSLRQALRDNQELLIDSIRALAAAIDAKNPYTRGHSEHVARYAVAIARHLGISGSELMRIEIAALLHDVGKIGIEDAILLKPQRLTDSEFQVMRTHPVKGAGIVASIKRLRDMLPGIRSHHESWDGTGYPDGLAGEKIPLLARIIAAADTFDAMTTERPYQMPMTFNAGLDRMRQLAGARLDPTVVGAFFKAVQTGDLVLLGQVEVA